jgi:hypothetical protein
VYTNGDKNQILIKAAADLNSLADLAGWGPVFQPVRIVALVAVVTNALGGAGVIKFDKRPTYGSDTGRGDGDVGSLALPDTTAIGVVIYKEVNITLNPGQQVVAEVTDATAGSDTADVYIVVEYLPDRPANFSAMLASA